MDKEKAQKIQSLRKELFDYYSHNESNIEHLEKLGFLFADIDYQTYNIVDKPVIEELEDLSNSIISK